MNKLRGLLLAVLFLTVANSWGACSWQVCFSGYEDCADRVYNGYDSHCTQTCSYDPPNYLGNCKTASYHYFQWRWGETKCVTDRGWYYLSAHVEGLRCDNQCEADSATCVLAGNIWQTDPSTSCGKSCKVNNCKAADTTWLTTSIASCSGVNNYAIVNTDSTCEHVGTCCDGLDSIPEGNSCKWRCDSVLTQCNGRAGTLFGAVLPDTSVSGQDTTFSYQCFYNCAYSPNPDSTVYIVEGNTVLAGPSDSIADGIKSEWFSSIRSTTGSIYVYDYLSPSASEYVDSIAAMKCVEHLWRCVINNKYVYWYDNQEVPAGCTNIVRVK